MNYALMVLFGLVPFWFCVNLGATDSTQINTTIHEVLNSIEWIEIPAGNFLMGSETEEVSALDLEASFRGAMVDLQHTFDSEKPLIESWISCFPDCSLEGNDSIELNNDSRTFLKILNSLVFLSVQMTTL